jgi:hypothetical protein
MNVKEHLKKHWWNYTFYFIMGITVIDAIPHFFEGWIAWKWGFYNIDLIPLTVITILLAYINICIRLNRLESKE